MSIDHPAEANRANGIGILTMVTAMALVPLVDLQAKVLGGLSPMQVVFLRMFCGALLILPVVFARRNPQLYSRKGWRDAAMLGFFSICGGFCFFGSLKYLSIADAVAISFVQPLFVTLFSRLFLKEKVDVKRWLALLVGFCATLIIIRPANAYSDIGSLLALGAGLAMACYAIVVKRGSKGVSGISPMTVCFQTHVAAAAVAAPTMIFFWSGASLVQWGIVVGMALLGLAVQYLIINAYHLGDASIIAPFA